MMKIKPILLALMICVGMNIPAMPAAADDEYYEIEISDEKQGWYKIASTGERTYYIEGERASGLTEINGRLFFFDENGVLLTETWKKADGNSYYFGKKGYALSGRQIIDGTDYIFGSDCRLLRINRKTNIVKSASAPYTYDDMSEDIERLAARYPELMEYSIIGTTADNRNIYDIVLGSPAADKQIVIQASCHAREYMTSLLVMEQLEYCLNGYYTEEYNGVLFKELFDNYAMHIIPMLNPDGVTISQLGIEGIKDDNIREELHLMYLNAVENNNTSYTEERYYQRWKANARGVDLNNNFDGRWEELKGAESPAGWSYKGEAPESEAESAAVTALIRGLSNPVTVISYHATGSVLWWDYGQTGEFMERCTKQAELISSLTGYPL
ncbi:MAG: M14 family zinc carboxypeptidase, partial [Oscillospiraceae bacterium]